MGRLIENLKLIVIVTAFVAIRNPIRTVRCDEVISASQKKLVDSSDSRFENLNEELHSLADRQRIRSVLPNKGKNVEPALSEETGPREPPVSETTLNNILHAAGTVSSQKCRENIQQVVAGIRRGQHWALGSKLL